MDCDALSEEALAQHCSRYFGINNFRDGQYPLIRAILSGKNVLGILPTGAGKSICFQLPALMSGDVSLVVSPLKSLMKDQVVNLHEKGLLCAEYMDSSMSPEVKESVLSQVKNGSVKLLYVSPERLMDARFREELKRAVSPRALAYFIIDEAHCVSEWGHDFRPSYLQMGRISKDLGARQRVAVTATASPRVKKDILKILDITEEEVYSACTLDRKELKFHVVEVPRTTHKERALLGLLKAMEKAYPGGSGLVFTVYAQPEGKYTAPLGTRFIHQYLKEQGITSEVYHGKLEDERRLKVQEMFKKDEIALLVATKGFGMGIDKPDIRYVIHMCYPASLEAYYQEAGRAGRDRQDAMVFILVRRRQNQCEEACAINGSMDPPCCQSWECFYEKGEKCDYGMQAKFIYDSCHSLETVQREAYELMLRIFRGGITGSPLHIHVCRGEEARCQMFFEHMAGQGLIEDYTLERYAEDGAGFLLRAGSVSYHEDDLFGYANMLAGKLMEQKEQKYRALQAMQAYAEEESGCRKQRILDYFADGTDFGPGGCGCCDMDGDSAIRIPDFTAEEPGKKAGPAAQRSVWWRDEDFWKTMSVAAGLILLWYFF